MGETTVAHVESVNNFEANGKVHAKTYFVVAAVNMIYAAQLISVVGSGALARNIAGVIGGAENIVWFTSIITICTVVLSPSMSQAADYWGRKWPLVSFTVLGFVGSIIVSRAQSPAAVLVGFTFSGLSFGTQPLVPTVVSEVLPRKYRPYAQASVNISGSLAAVATLLFGGALTRNGDNEGFRTYWYICAGIYALAALLCLFFYNPPLRELQSSLNFSEKLRKLDWVGYALLTAGLILFCVGLSWSQNPYPWSNPLVSAPFGVGLALTIMFILYEWLVKKDGMIHYRLFQNRNFPLALGCLFVEGLAFFSANNYFAFQTNVLVTTDPVLVGAHFAIVFISGILFSAVGAAYCYKTKSIRVPVIAGFTSFLTGFILLATVTPSTPKNVFWGYPVFLGGGLGLSVTSLMVAAQFSTPPDLISTTTGLVLAMRNLGGTVGLAVYNAVFNNEVAQNMAPKIAAKTLPLGLPKSSLGALISGILASDFAGLAKIHGVTPDIIKAAVLAEQEAYTVAFRYVWVTAGAFSAAALIASFFIINPTEDFNHHIDAPVEPVAKDVSIKDEA